MFIHRSNYFTNEAWSCMKELSISFCQRDPCTRIIKLNLCGILPNVKAWLRPVLNSRSENDRVYTLCMWDLYEFASFCKAYSKYVRVYGLFLLFFVQILCAYGNFNIEDYWRPTLFSILHVDNRKSRKQRILKLILRFNP